MSWDAIAAIAELLGATAVVVSLAFLAIQIRVSSRCALGIRPGELFNEGDVPLRYLFEHRSECHFHAASGTRFPEV